MNDTTRSEPVAPAVGSQVQRPVGRLVLLPRRPDAPQTSAPLVPGAPRCGYCWQPATDWDASDAARGKRAVYGGVQYHCYAAKCWD